MIALWSFIFLDWVLYIIVLKHYTKKKDYKMLWYFNFGETCLLTVFVFLTSLFFLIAFSRINRLDKLIGEAENNSRQLNKYKKYTRTAFAG